MHPDQELNSQACLVLAFGASIIGLDCSKWHGSSIQDALIGRIVTL